MAGVRCGLLSEPHPPPEGRRRLRVGVGPQAPHRPWRRLLGRVLHHHCLLRHQKSWEGWKARDTVWRSLSIGMRQSVIEFSE